MRLPGTGDGVARLVDVSMVKVDMGGLLAGTPGNSQSRPAVRLSTMWNIYERLFVTRAGALVVCPRDVKWS
jgi:hypothetical protein